MTKRQAQELFGNIGEYNSDPRKVLLRKKKKLRLKKKAKIFLSLLVLSLIVLYFISDLSRIRTISVEGNQTISTKYIQKVLSQYKKDTIFLLNTNKVEKKVLDMPLIKKADVSKNLLGHLSVRVSEGDILAYATIKNKTYIIDSMGHVFENSPEMGLGDVKKYVKVSYFKSYGQLKNFAKEYVKIPENVHSSVSDIILSNSKTEPFRVRMIMDNGKILVVRVNEMVDVFERFDYQANNVVQKDVQTYVFMNGKLYMYSSDDKFDYKK